MAINTLDETMVAGAQSILATDPEFRSLAIVAANWGILILPIVLVGLWLRAGSDGRQIAITASLSAIISLTIAGVVSFLFYVPRPFALGLVPNILDHVADSSFPSDHVTVMAAVATAFLFGKRYVIGSLTALAMLVVGAARVALGVHFASDIIAAVLLGTAISAAFRTQPIAEFAHFCCRMAEAVYAGLGIETVANRLHLQKNQEIL